MGYWWLPRIPPSWHVAVLAALLLQVAPAIVMAEERVPGIKRFDPATKAKVLAALAGLIILGFAMVALTWLGARIVERYRHRQPYHNPTPRPGEHDWAQKPLAGRATRTRSDPTGGELGDE